MAGCVVISGCSGGGKSTLLSELGRQGYRIVDEPARRLIRQEMALGGSALPWADAEAFARKLVEIAKQDLADADGAEAWTFFDRGLLDAAIFLQYLTGTPAGESLSGAKRYFHTVFLTPPWREIFRNDDERRHSYEEAVEEYENLESGLPALGYDICRLPRVCVPQRADFMLNKLKATPLVKD